MFLATTPFPMSRHVGDFGEVLAEIHRAARSDRSGAYAKPNRADPTLFVSFRDGCHEATARGRTFSPKRH